MTLKTTVAVHDPLPVREVYAFCRALLGTPDHIKPDTNSWGCWPRIGNPIGIGLSALMWVSYGADGPMLEPPHPDEDDDDRAFRESEPTSDGWAALAVCFDTAYGYRADNGAGCGDLHAWLVARLGEWLDGRGARWKWEDEYSGEWFDGPSELHRLGDADRGALLTVV